MSKFLKSLCGFLKTFKVKELCAVILLGCIVVNYGQRISQNQRPILRLPLPMKFKQRWRERWRERNTKMVCYDLVGCFNTPHKNSPLQKFPEDPRILATKFFLFTRKLNFSSPEVIYYNDDGKSLGNSTFNVFNPLKLIVHGYMSKWNEKGALTAVDAFLKLCDCNIILVDWRMGARGPQYTSAAANTEIVGRELGLLLVRMVESGLDPKNIHLIGFSLGAHVAGASSESLKQKGHLIGRITGLDAASPLFRNNHFREPHKKLDKTDAEYVDVLHTDSSPFVTDGFGLWEPIGHVDFFPNGGQEQPGCRDPRSSIVVTHLEGTHNLNRETACSHIRAFQLFIETLMNKVKKQENETKNICRFTTFSCPGGLQSFERGHCFPQINEKTKSSPIGLNKSYLDDIGEFGVDGRGRGVMYFSTRDGPPYCGTQLQASIHISQKTGSARGILKMDLFYLGHTVSFQIKIELLDFVMTGSIMNSLAVAEFNSLDLEKVKVIKAKISYMDLELEENKNQTTYGPTLYLDKAVVRDMYGNRFPDDIITEGSYGYRHWELMPGINLCLFVQIILQKVILSCGTVIAKL